MVRCVSRVVVLVGVIATGTMSAQQAAVSPAETKDANLCAYVELRADVRVQKVAFLTELMEFTAAEDKAFWPIYREYDVELSTINDERVTGIDEYSRNYEKVSDALETRLQFQLNAAVTVTP